jgi:hypothetical protein
MGNARAGRTQHLVKVERPSYLGAAAAFPLRDSQMIWVDRHLGFDWLAIMSSLEHHLPRSRCSTAPMRPSRFSCSQPHSC